MVWISKNKKIALKSITPQKQRQKAGVCGRAPSNAHITFTPVELFGAMARCSNLHPIDPDAVTFESESCRHLVAHHVDDQADGFFFLPTAKQLKDYSRTHLVGVVGDGIAYLQMMRDGYVWCDHFENLKVTGARDTKQSPDFVFNRPGDDDVAITESKATSGSSRKQFFGTVEKGYLNQVSPYLGLKIGGATASHGFSIGSWMSSKTGAELLIHHTAQTAHPSAAGTPSSPMAVRRGNYLTVLSLMFGARAAAAAREGSWPPPIESLLTVHWLDREWVLGRPLMIWGVDAEEGGDWIPWLNHPPLALELGIFSRILPSLSSDEIADTPFVDLPRMDEALTLRARESGGAVYPDGFALIGRKGASEKGRILGWNPQSGKLVDRGVVEFGDSLTRSLRQAAEDREEQIMWSLDWQANEETESPSRLVHREPE